MVHVNEYTMGGVKYTDITLTRGDDCVLVLPIYSVAADGTRTAYTPSGSDTFSVAVRKKAITNSGTTPTAVISGTVTVVDGKPNWTITHSASTIDAGDYVWDIQITKSSKVYTFYQGNFTILPEVAQ